MRLLTYIFLVFSICKANAQSLVSSNTSIESCNEIEGCVTSNGTSFLYYDESKSEFFLKVDFSTFRNSNDKADNWLNNEKDTCFYYRAIFPKEQFPNLSNQKSKSFKLNGKINFNGKWKDQPIEIMLYSSENSIISTSGINTNNLKYENYKVNFSIPFVPGDFKEYSQLYYNAQTVNVNLTLGRINLLTPGMEYLLDNAYTQIAE